MNLLDVVLIVLILFAALSGFRRGALMQLAIYAGLLAGLVVGALLAPRLAGLATEPTTQAIVALGTFVILGALGDALGWVIGRRLWAATRASGFGAADAAGGSLVAVGALLLATWFVALNLATGPSAALAREIRGSAIIRGLDAVMPAPPPLLQQIRKFLNRFGFPEVFAGLPPAPAGPVGEPSQAQAGKAFDEAAASTVRIVGSACGRVQEGSGFVVANSYVITNAHVVAGVRAPRVQEQNGPSQGGTAVLFDPKLDVAVLRVANTPGPPLVLLGREVARGAKGAVVGYPEGGALSGQPAANRRVLHAVGRDIYGHGTVSRDIYELQAVVRPGNSGGPFILVDGDVAGLVFASSTTDSGVGYAITSQEIRPDVRRAVGRTAAVSTGGCAE